MVWYARLWGHGQPMERHIVSRTLAVAMLAAALGLAGCKMADSTPALPTATALPTQVIPTSTATALPPPTVTGYPSPTMRGAESAVDQPTISAGPVISAPGASTSGPQATSAPITTPTPAPTEAPTATPTVSFVNLPAGISLAGSVYTSTFDGWPAFNDPTARTSFSNGHYHFDIGPFDGRFLNSTALNAGDVYIELDVTPQSCPDKAGYGVMFHFKDANNYYLLTIFCDNTFNAVVKVAGSVSALSYDKLPGGLDATSNETHHLGVLAHGNEYTLYLEGQPLGSFSDGQFSKGDVAIYAVSQGGKVLKIDFESLKVWSVQ